MCICDSYLCFIELSSLSWTGGPCVPYRAQMQSKHVTTIAKRFTIKWQFYYFYLHRPLSLLAGAFPTEMGTNTITANSTTTPICCGERSVWKNLGFIYSFRFNVNTKPKHPLLLIKKKRKSISQVYQEKAESWCFRALTETLQDILCIHSVHYMKNPKTSKRKQHFP